QQYKDIKAMHPGYVLFYRLGDFYEMFFEDAEQMSRELSLTLTARQGTPMCGVPHHSAENYIRKLIRAGYRVAMCEQLEKEGKIHREVTKLITPGTITQESFLDEDKNNYLMSFYRDSSGVTGVAASDLSTGALYVHGAGLSGEQEVIDLIAKFMPAEVMFNAAFMDMRQTGDFLRERVRCLAEVAMEAYFVPERDFVTARLANLGSVSVADDSAVGALAALIKYIDFTQKRVEVRFTSLKVGGGGAAAVGNPEARLRIGVNTRRNLELTETLRTREKRGTLLWVLDRTKTAMGRRRLRELISEPFAEHLTIVGRLDAVEELTRHSPRLGEIREAMGGIYDLERLISRVVYKTSNPRDLYALGQACGTLPAIKRLLTGFAGNSGKLLCNLEQNIDALGDINALIANAITPEPPATVKDGGYIANGFNAELDRLRELAGGGEKLLCEIEAREKAATGISSLKVGYNRVFGYYIEISRAALANAEPPEGYFRKQTLTNAERYITDELKRVEEDILSAKDKAIALEAEILKDVKAFLEAALERIHTTARAIAEIDVLCALADTAIRENYCRPEISLDGVIDIKDSRHPVVEKVLPDTVAFTPNDCRLDSCKKSQNRLGIITGPNMAGKSTYMRQIALIVIMAQIGSFVPAKSARLGIADQIFTRVGASDDLASGQSTFMVEMLEVAEILRDATVNSFVILDEIGRGTSTYDGVSIAKAVAEQINNKIGCKTLFATHYHELVQLEKHNPGVFNLSVSVAKRGEDLTFLHKIVSGGTDRSFGIEVAKLAGVPQSVLSNARRTLAQMELGNKIELEQQLAQEEESETQIDFTLLARDSAISRLRAVDLNNLTPFEALTELRELKKMLE
ncbi:MAG: DNA mismatch repair protein MutS, partial [Oscillospiraceae bacterium]|nr:DNA mismatch repair protein MutS [Oscillospiraceae bacterium]